MDKFCCKCGKATVKRLREGFDTQTGEQLFDLVCPTGECFHSGFNQHDIESHLEDRGLFRSPWFIGKCKRCGKQWKEVLTYGGL